MSIDQQIIREAPEIEAFKLDQMEKAKLLAEGFLPELIPDQTVAGQTAGQIAAKNAAYGLGVGSFAPYLTSASGLTGEARGVGMGALGQYDPRMAYGFMDPYQQAVTDKVMSELDRQATIQGQTDAARAVQAGAFGGTREGVQRAETARNLQDVKARALADQYSQNFRQAQDAAMGSFESAKNRQAGIGSLLGALGAQYGNLGQLDQSMTQADITFLDAVGRNQQLQDQARLDAFRENELKKLYSPFEMAGFISDVYKGAPSTQMVTSQKTGGDQASGLEKGISTIGSLYFGGKAVGAF